MPKKLANFIDRLMPALEYWICRLVILAFHAKQLANVSYWL